MAKFKERYKYIGASDFPAIMGKSKWKTREKLALEKGLVIAPNEEENSAMARGTRLEPIVIKKFTEITGIKIINFQKEVVLAESPKCMKLLAHLDGETENGICFEAKTTLKSNKWVAPPDYYIPQLEFQMFLNHCDKSYIAVGYVEDDNSEDICGIDYFEWERTMTDEEIIKECENFTELVRTFKTKYGVINNGLIVQNNEIDSMVSELEELKEQISNIQKALKPFEEKKKTIEANLKQLIGINSGVESGLYKITLGNRITSPTNEYGVSRSLLKVEYKGG